MNRRTVALLAFAGLLAGCAVHPTVSALRALPGASARYPGSVAVVRPGGIEGSHTLFANNASVLLATYCSQASSARVTAWFDTRLTSLGWTRESDPTGVAGTDATSLTVWDRHDRTFRLTMKPPSYAAAAADRTGHPCATAYQVLVQ